MEKKVNRTLASKAVIHLGWRLWIYLFFKQSGGSAAQWASQEQVTEM